MYFKHKPNRALEWFLAILLVFYASFAIAAIPTTITYQGYLTDANGVPETSTLNAEFKLYEQSLGDAAVWMEMHTFDVTNGFFQVDLGSKTPFQAGLFDNPIFLGIKIGADAEMTPRLRFSSVPTAFVAEGSISCSNGETNCDGSCADLQADAENCGSCGTACNTGSGESCFAGVCGIDSCGSGVVDGNETDVDCGGGDCAACAEGQECALGTDCLSGLCSGNVCVVDLDEDGYASDVDCNDSAPQIHPGADELCNGIDDDCDAAIDEDIPNPQPCPLQQGVCAGVSSTCQGGQWTTCTDNDYGTAFQFDESVCDGLDNDCDGQIDEAFDLNSDLNNCGSCGIACDTPASECFQAVCSGGVCANAVDDGTSCGATPNECTLQDQCNSGICTDFGFAESGTACAGGGTCDGEGSCLVPQ